MAFRSCNVLIMISSVFLLLLISFPSQISAEISEEVAEKLKLVNERGAHYGLVVSGNDELKVIREALFQPYERMPTIDISARRFYVGDIRGRRVILVMSGSGMVNGAKTTQLLLSLFRISGVINYGRGGNADPEQLHIGDIAIPRQWAHTGVWHWEKFGGDDESYVRDIAKLTFSDYNVVPVPPIYPPLPTPMIHNSLQTVYFQPEAFYSTPEVGKRKFWIKVDNELYALAEGLKGVKLDQCKPAPKLYDMCLQEKPLIKSVERGSTSNLYVNNVAYRDFLRYELNISAIDRHSAAIALVCKSEKKAFIAMRSITSFAGGDPPKANDLNVIKQLWPAHARTFLGKYFEVLPQDDSMLRSVTGSNIY